MDIMYNMPYRELILLEKVKMERLTKEEEELKKLAEKEKREGARKAIMKPYAS